MAEQHGVRLQPRGLPDQLRHGGRVAVAIDEPHLMPRIDERPADGEQAERRQVVARDAAANGGMRRVNQQDTHWRPPRGWNAGSGGGGNGEAAEPAFAPPEIVQRRGEIGLAEVRPQALREIEFRIGAFPQEEVGEALLARWCG